MSFDNSKAALAAAGVSKVLCKWQCSEQVKSVLLGFESEALFQVMDSNPSDYTFTAEQVERIGYILNIYRSLHTLFSEADQADAWLNKPNSNELFGGQPAIELMRKGKASDLASVAEYLQVQY